MKDMDDIARTSKEEYESEHNLRIEKDMLQGNLARLSLSNDVEEIERMREWAHKRVDIIADFRVRQIIDKKGEIK